MTPFPTPTSCYSELGGPPTLVPTNRCSPAGRPHIQEPAVNEDGPVATSEESWHQFLTELDTYVDEHNHSRVSQHTTTPSGYPLGRKVNEARTNYNADRLTLDRIKELNARPGWAWNANRGRWLDQFDRVAAFYREHQSLTGLPSAQRQWLLRQRWAQDHNTLDSEQQRLLDQIPEAHAPRDTVEMFIDAATQWLQDHPGSTLADVTGPSIIEHRGKPYPLRKRMIYYRRRRAGLEGTHPLPEQDVARLEELPGWNWDGARASYSSDTSHD